MSPPELIMFMAAEIVLGGLILAEAIQLKAEVKSIRSELMESLERL